MMPSKLGVAIKQFVSGEPGSAERVVAAAAPLCHRQAALLVEDAAIDDVVQESLVELLASARRLRHPDAAEAWVRLIVRKQAERHRRRLRFPLPLDLAAEFPSSIDGPEATLLRSEQDAIVRRALGAARDADRRLLVLRYAGDWGDAELAELLGTTPGAIRKRLSDARRRLRPQLTAMLAVEEPMTQSRSVPFGTALSVADLGDEPTPPLAPARSELLATGMRVIDAVVPLRRGGTVDFRGPFGTGHLVLICELARNLATTGATAVVAVASEPVDADPTSSLLQRLIESDGVPELTVVVDAAPDAHRALEAASKLAARLAHPGADVLLLVDRAACAQLEPHLLTAHSGLVGTGSVTTFRMAPHPRGADPAESWPLDSTIVLSLERMAMGILPAVDVLESHSTLIDQGELSDEATHIALDVRHALTVASNLDRLLAQPFRVAEPYTGTPGLWLSAEQARRELAAQL
jgi:RNA polymerase sigma factor (sigma-70 family)